MSKTKLNSVTTTKLERIMETSAQDPKRVFNCLMPHFNKESLISCFHELDERKAIGADKQSKGDYALNLESNIEHLITSMKTMSYRPKPLREVKIPKLSGGVRSLGISCIEDKIVQLMIAKILESLYEPLFRHSSYGFRPGRNCHQAIKNVNQFIFHHWSPVVLDVDLENFFGSIEHSKMLALLRLRIKDERFLRLIARMLKSGILSPEGVKKAESGTPQGSICSPILANIFAHYALDTWFEDTVRPCLRGRADLTRYCDDVVISFASQQDAKRVWKVLPKMLARFSLSLNEGKSKLVALDKRLLATGHKQGTFKFLGFTFFLDSNPKGTIIPKVKTDGVRMREKIKEIKSWIKFERNRTKLKPLWLKLVVRLKGYVRYYGVSHNGKSVNSLIRAVIMVFYKWMNRRSHKRSISWGKFLEFMRRYPMTSFKVHHKLF